MEKNKEKIRKLCNHFILYGVMLFYLLIMVYLLFLQRQTSSFRSINLVPFRTISNYLFSPDIKIKAFAVTNLLGNIVVFIPLGIYVILLNRKKSLITNTLIVAFISIVVEIVQFVGKVGVMDIDDVLLNTVGGLLGVAFYKVLELIFKEKIKFAVGLTALIGGAASLLILILLNR